MTLKNPDSANASRPIDVMELGQVMFTNFVSLKL